MKSAQVIVVIMVVLLPDLNFIENCFVGTLKVPIQEPGPQQNHKKMQKKALNFTLTLRATGENGAYQK